MSEINSRGVISNLWEWTLFKSVKEYKFIEMLGNYQVFGKSSVKCNHSRFFFLIYYYYYYYRSVNHKHERVNLFFEFTVLLEFKN